jgi:hypothetical protein
VKRTTILTEKEVGSDPVLLGFSGDFFSGDFKERDNRGGNGTIDIIYKQFCVFFRMLSNRGSP